LHITEYQTVISNNNEFLSPVLRCVSYGIYKEHVLAYVIELSIIKCTK
jgi:hypothetical protein